MTSNGAYKRAMVKGWSKELEDIVVDSKDPYETYQFARDVEGANIERLEQVVINYGNLDLIYYFALDIPGANISDIIYALKEDPEMIKRLFDERPKLKRKFVLDSLGSIREIRSIVRESLK